MKYSISQWLSLLRGGKNLICLFVSKSMEQRFKSPYVDSRHFTFDICTRDIILITNLNIEKENIQQTYHKYQVSISPNFCRIMIPYILHRLKQSEYCGRALRLWQADVSGTWGFLPSSKLSSRISLHSVQRSTIFLFARLFLRPYPRHRMLCVRGFLVDYFYSLHIYVGLTCWHIYLLSVFGYGDLFCELSIWKMFSLNMASVVYFSGHPACNMHAGGLF